LVAIFVLVFLAGGLAAAWVATNYYTPGAVKTPAHAGIVSHGQPDRCANENFVVRPRAQETRRVTLEDSGSVRGTFEAHGGVGHVDILLRVVDPQGLDIYASPRVEIGDFYFSVPIRGEYAFEFDNRYSLYTSKSVGLFYCFEPGPAPFTPFVPR
jgi:hypothetical protein